MDGLITVTKDIDIWLSDYEDEVAEYISENTDIFADHMNVQQLLNVISAMKRLGGKWEFDIKPKLLEEIVKP